MKILLLSPLVQCSGNYTTVCRLRGHFASSSISCVLTSPDYFTNRDEFMTIVQQTGCDLILAIHAYKSGLLLKGCKVPYIIILGGTDVNECTDDPVKMAAMTEAIMPAKHIVCFGTSLQTKFFEKWPEFRPENVSVIPQAVETNPSAFCLRSYIKNNILPKRLSQECQVPGTSQNESLLSQNELQKEESNLCKLSSDQNVQLHRERNRLQNERKLYCIQREKERNRRKQSEKENFYEKQSFDGKAQSHDQRKQSHDQRKQSHDQRKQTYYIIKDFCDTLPSHTFDQTLDKNEASHDNLNNAGDSVEQIFHYIHFHDLIKWSHVSEPTRNGDSYDTKSGLSKQVFDYGFHGNPSKDNCVSETIGRQSEDTSEEPLFFTMVGGIRPVKDQLYLVEEFSEWAKKKRTRCCLLIVGPKMDDEYFFLFEKKTESLQSVIHIPRLSLQDTHVVIRDSFALVNTSLSEGMAISILEAMCLNTPVIVRDIPGNRNIVTDGETGLLFKSVQDFFMKADFLLDNKEEIKRLTDNAFRYVLESHSMVKEKQTYVNLAQRICDKKTCD